MHFAAHCLAPRPAAICTTAADVPGSAPAVLFRERFALPEPLALYFVGLKEVNDLCATHDKAHRSAAPPPVGTRYLHPLRTLPAMIGCVRPFVSSRRWSASSSPTKAAVASIAAGCVLKFLAQGAQSRARDLEGTSSANFSMRADTFRDRCISPPKRRVPFPRRSLRLVPQNQRSDVFDIRTDV